MITVISYSPTLLRFEWSPPPAIEENGLIRYYIVRLTERHTGREWTFFVVDDNINVGNLHPYYFYDFIVAAHTIGLGPYSDVHTVLTDEDIPSSPPQEVTATTITPTALTLTWNPPLFEKRNGRVRYYHLQILEMETGKIRELTANTTNINIFDLHPYYTYQCSIAAFTVNLGPYSDVITIQLPEEGLFLYMYALHDNTWLHICLYMFIIPFTQLLLQNQVM